MKKRASRKQETESSTTQNRCIWMTAGVISFKLCPLDYDCENCDFDEAMRSQVRSRRISAKDRKEEARVLMQSEDASLLSTDSGKPLFFTFSAGDVEPELYLHPNHVWLRPDAGKRWKLGIDALLAYVLPRTSHVELHEPDGKLQHNQLLGRLRTQAGILPLATPLSGHLVQVNPQLGEHPELVQEKPYKEGWLATIEPFEDESDLKRCYTGAAGRKFLEEEAQHLKFLLKHRGIEVDSIGETLPDGGAHIRYLHQVLPGSVCLRLAIELVMSGKQAW